MHGLLLMSVFYGALFLACYYFAFRYKKSISGFGAAERFHPGAICAGLLLLTLLQLKITMNMPGYVQDTALFRSWAAFAETHPVWEYYTAELYVDYPPVYLYVLYALGKLAGLLGISSESNLYLSVIRSVPILFDALTLLCIYCLSRKKIGEIRALVLTLLNALNPANLMNSTLWGQIDSVTAFMAAAVLWLLYQRRYMAVGALFALLVLTKPQMIIFAPLIGFTFIFDIIERRFWPQRRIVLRQILLAVLAATAVLLLIPLPITGGNYMLLIEKYRQALGLYPYATLNAANLYGALGANWKADSEQLWLFSYKTWGFIFIVLISLAIGCFVFKRRDRNKIFWLGVFTVLGIYMLAHGMHERYLHPALLLLLILYVRTGDRGQLWFYGGFSLTTFLNCGQVLLLNQKDQFVYGDNPLFIALSAVQLALFVLWLRHGIRGNNRAEALDVG